MNIFLSIVLLVVVLICSFCLGVFIGRVINLGEDEREELIRKERNEEE